MVRFILRKSYKDCNTGDTGKRLFTLEAECPALEKILTSGGYAEDGYEYNDIVDAETFTTPPAPVAGKGAERG